MREFTKRYRVFCSAIKNTSHPIFEYSLWLKSRWIDFIIEAGIRPPIIDPILVAVDLYGVEYQDRFDSFIEGRYGCLPDNVEPNLLETIYADEFDRRL